MPHGSNIAKLRRFMFRSRQVSAAVAFHLETRIPLDAVTCVFGRTRALLIYRDKRARDNDLHRAQATRWFILRRCKINAQTAAS